MLVIVFNYENEIIERPADFGGATFSDGECYFECDGEEYRIKIENIIEIYAR